MPLESEGTDLFGPILILCIGCKEQKAKESFGPGARYPRCLPCRVARAKALKNARKKRQHQRRTPEEKNLFNRRKSLRQKYGMSLDTYDAILKKQGGRCKICRADKPGGAGAKFNVFSVDHDHNTGAVRGLLCGLCNITIGSAREDAEILRATVKYLDAAPLFSIPAGGRFKRAVVPFLCVPSGGAGKRGESPF